jgi:hypothetical protein
VCQSFATGVTILESFILRQRKQPDEKNTKPAKLARIVSNSGGEEAAWRQLYPLCTFCMSSPWKKFSESFTSKRKYLKV